MESRITLADLQGAAGAAPIVPLNRAARRRIQGNRGAYAALRVAWSTRYVTHSLRVVAWTVFDRLAASPWPNGTTKGGRFSVAKASAKWNGGEQLHPRTVQRALQALVQLGVLEIYCLGGKGRPGGRGMAHVYRPARAWRDVLAELTRVSLAAVRRWSAARCGESAASAREISISLGLRRGFAAQKGSAPPTRARPLAPMGAGA